MSAAKNKKKYYFEYLQKTESFPRNLYHRVKHQLVAQVVRQLAPHSFILDAGCGLGNITAKYCSDHHVVGVDEQLPAIKYCRRHFQGLYKKGSLYRLPLSSSKFDLVLLLDTIEHLKRPEKALEELARVLKPRGRILVCTINYDNLFWLLLENTWHRLFGGNCKTYSSEMHPTRYTARLLAKHCQKFFQKVYLKKHVLKMELFYLGKKR